MAEDGGRRAGILGALIFRLVRYRIKRATLIQTSVQWLPSNELIVNKTCKGQPRQRCEGSIVYAQSGNIDYLDSSRRIAGNILHEHPTDPTLLPHTPYNKPYKLSQITRTSQI